MKNFSDIINQKDFTKSDIISMLSAKGNDEKLLFAKAKEIKEIEIGKKVYYRGLVEFSNICEKNCLYCGIRKDNKSVDRFKSSHRMV